MTTPFSVARLLEEWLLWAAWAHDPSNEGLENPHPVGFDEFDWVVREHPEHAWNTILAVVADPRARPYLGILAAGPMEDLLSRYGDDYIERVEAQAKSNPAFASMLGGVWRLEMSEEVWARVQSVWDRRGWDGNPETDA